MPGFILPRPHQEIGGQPAAGGTPIGGAPAGRTLDQRILVAQLACAGGTGDEAACKEYLSLIALKAQMVQSGQLQAGSATVGTISGLLQGSTTGLVTTGRQWAYPFDPKYFNAKYLTLKFGAEPGEWGNDYGLPSGTPIYSPFAGTVVGVENNGDQAWGTRIFVQGADGTIFAVGHVREGSTLGIGTRVRPGDQLALSGGGIGTGGQPLDSGHGDSTGSHVEIQVIRSGGSIYNRNDYVDSQPWLQNIFFATPSSLGMPDGYYTIDGHFIENGSREDVFYSMAKSVWRKSYATDPPWSIVQALAASGVQTIDDLQAVLNAMPSSVPGVNIGTYEAVNSNLQRIGSQRFGVPMTQSLLRQFLAEGLTTLEQMQGWFDTHPASAIPKDEFKAAYDIANQWTHGVWNTTPTLDQVAAVHQKAITMRHSGKPPEPVAAGGSRGPMAS